MAELIMSYAVKTILIILSLFVYVFLIARVFPKLFLTPNYKSVKAQDRGVKKYTFENGRAIVFEPALKIRKYISQYILSDNDGERFVKCKLDKQITSIRYDVVAFDSSDRFIDTLEVYEDIETEGVTKAVALPLNTAYIALSIRDVNGAHVAEDPIAAFSMIKICAFVLLTTAATVAMSLMCKSLMVYFADLLINYTAIYGAVSNTFAIISALLLSAAYCSIVWISHRGKDTKIN